MSISIPAADLPKIAPNGVIIDVRTKMEHTEKRLTCAHAHIPLDQLNPRAFMTENNLGPDTPVYILCRSGSRATQAAAHFMAAGYPNVSVIDGGIIACENCGQSVTGTTVSPPAPTNANSCCSTPGTAPSASLFTIRRPITLERQVRITAGTFILAGLFGATFIHPGLITLTAFVGAGLIYAGLSDRCGMALMLARAPWNKI